MKARLANNFSHDTARIMNDVADLVLTSGHVDRGVNHILSSALDLGIAAAYFVIPLSLFKVQSLLKKATMQVQVSYLLSDQEGHRFRLLQVLFSGFVLCCGVTHLFHSLSTCVPLMLVAKSVTFAVSTAASVLLWSSTDVIARVMAEIEIFRRGFAKNLMLSLHSEDRCTLANCEDPPKFFYNGDRDMEAVFHLTEADSTPMITYPENCKAECQDQTCQKQMKRAHALILQQLKTPLQLARSALAANPEASGQVVEEHLRRLWDILTGLSVEGSHQITSKSCDHACFPHAIAGSWKGEDEVDEDLSSDSTTASSVVDYVIQQAKRVCTLEDESDGQPQSTMARKRLFHVSQHALHSIEACSTKQEQSAVASHFLPYFV